MKKFLLCATIPAALTIHSFAGPEDASLFVAQPVNGQTFGIMKDSASYLEFTVGGWGSNWKYFKIKGTPVNAGGSMVARNTGTIDNTDIMIDVKAGKSGPNQLQLDYDLSSAQSVELTSIIVGIKFNSPFFAEGKALVKTADGGQATVPFPLGKAGLGKQVKECILTDNSGLQTKLLFEPACDILSDNQGRIVLAEKKLSQPVHQTVTITLPGNTEFYATAADIPVAAEIRNWYPFTPTSDGSKAGEIGLQDWLEKPAGKYGRITRDGEKLIYNGKPIKLWGMNNCYANGSSPEKPIADRRAAFYAKYGINAIRFHKFADGSGFAGFQSKQSFLEFDPAGFDRMDYFVSKLKEAGIYVLLSPNFGVKLGPADMGRVPYLSEFGPLKKDRVIPGFQTIYLSRELQDMQIEHVVKILTHKNQYTGKTYAEEPSVMAVELINEESIMFFGTKKALKTSPTLRKRTSEAFCDWLQKRYGSEEKLMAAWGPDSLNCSPEFPGENWADKTIVPVGDPWMYDPDQLATPKGHKARMLDTMQFLYELQNDFYSRYIKAIRDTGYTGEILSSNWQAGRDFSHYYNLHSDAMVGLIDRHNYFGGNKKLGASRINNASALSLPGSGMLSSGLQQVGNRPFMLSEWINVTPNEWGVEGPAVIGAYGMGLQGWDVSFIFQNSDSGTFLDEIPMHGRPGWHVMTPHVLGVFPAVARQVLRGDIKESAVPAVRNVHIPSLHEGKLGFSDRVEQDEDTKELTSDTAPPAQALAATRCVVNFTDTYVGTPKFDLSRYTTNGGIASVTGELFWKPGKNKMDGFITINAAATKAVVGFAQGQKCVLGDVTIEPASRFGAIYVSAQERDKNIATSGNLLVTAIARSRNTGMKVGADTFLLEKGTAPIVMEPVKARITLKRNPSGIYLLDHDGVRTATTLPVENGSFEIDGARDKTCYYLVTFE